MIEMSVEFVRVSMQNYNRVVILEGEGVGALPA